jgi:hypothetical protein
MPTFTRKHATVEARQHFGSNLPVSSIRKGEQICQSGDFLVVDDAAVDDIAAREKAEGLAPHSLPKKGTIYVVSKADFLREFDAKDETPAIIGEQGFDVPDELPVPGELPEISTLSSRSKTSPRSSRV